MFSVNDLNSFKSVKEKWVAEITEHFPTTPFILVENKTDLEKRAMKTSQLRLASSLGVRLKP